MNEQTNTSQLGIKTQALFTFFCKIQHKTANAFE